MSTMVSGRRLIDASLFAPGTVSGDGEPVLLGSACSACGAVTFPAQGSCPRCTSGDVEARPLPQQGTLWAFTVQRFPPKTPYLGADRPFTPYAVGYVDLGGQVLVESRLVGDPALLRIGQPVRLVWETIDEDAGGAIDTFAFTPAEGGQ